MVSPIAAYRDMRALELGKIQPRPLSMIEKLAWTILVMGTTFAIVWIIRDSGVGRAYYGGHRRINWYAQMMASAVPVLAAVLVWAMYRRWRDGGTEAFEFPATIPQLGYRIVHREGDAALYLTNGLLLVGLLVRAADETIEQVLEALDPDAELEADDAERGTLRFDVPGQPAAYGVICATTRPRAFIVIVADTEHAADDLASLFARVGSRKPRQKPQKWRHLDPPKLATARTA